MFVRCGTMLDLGIGLSLIFSYFFFLSFTAIICPLFFITYHLSLTAIHP
jgi:hypothetical protein